MSSLTRQAILIIAAIVLLAIVVFAGPAACQKIRSMAAQGRLDREQSAAQANSAADAVNTVAASGEATAASEELSRNNEKEIRDAQGANDPVSDAARDAGIRSLCRRAAYRDTPRCKLLKPPAG